MEIWKIIPDYPAYRVSNLGRIQSNRSGKWRNIIPRKHSKGWLQVKLHEDTDRCTWKALHRLVANLFMDAPTKDKPVIKFKDNDPTKCRVDNLYYGNSKAKGIKKKYKTGALKKDVESVAGIFLFKRLVL